MRPAGTTEDSIEGLLAGMSRELRCSIWLVKKNERVYKRINIFIYVYLLVYSTFMKLRQHLVDIYSVTNA